MKPRTTSIPECVEAKEDKRFNINNLEVLDETNTIKLVFRGDLYVIGKLWIDAVQKGLIGKTANLIPLVEAKAPEVPQKPPKMKCTELPLYKSPHYDYKDYIEDKKKCPDANVKLIHKFLLPYVKRYREQVRNNFCCVKCCLERNCANACAAVRRSKDDFKRTMRDPNNLMVRQGVVAAGTFTGYLLGSRGGIPRRLLFTSLGILAAGALCFPKETDEIFRTFAFCAGRALLAIYNNTCGKDINLRDRIPCSDELPPPTPATKPIQCPPKK